MSIINVNEIGPVSVGGTVSVTAGADLDVHSGSNLNYHSGSNLNCHSGSNLNVHSGSKIVGTDAGSIYAPGMVVQVVQSTIGTYGTISVAAYANNLNNLVQVPNYYVDITTKLANSKIRVEFKSAMRGNNQQHHYVDLRRRIGSSSTYTSMVDTYRPDTTIDTMAGIHDPAGGTHEGDYFASILDSPNQPAGTALRYQQYYGHWNAGTINYGGWDASGNPNARTMITMIATEIAG
tara:strand:+ start:116 stop:820 length:705 start_codon:yes stop_codon:yes gene_type:complete